MDLGLTGKRALVTGASKGIGLAVARSLVREGAMVVAAARRSTPELDELVAGGGAQFIAADLSRPEGPGELVVAALAGGPLDILVNNVGAVNPRLAGFLSITDEEWLASLNLSFMAGVRTRVNTVSPGPVATELWLGDHGVAATVAGATGGDPAAVQNAAAGDSASGRFTQPEEVADLVVLLASERAGNVIGADFVIDGGLIRTL
jgi:NAD(P)-dependent dehydrogenase (short-subunit alcohol dehydrogenase family)